MSAERTRERILEAACALVVEEGIDGVRIARVARRAGASTALVHHYFSTREDLLTEALLQAFELAAEERFGEEVEVEGSASAALASVIAQCLPDERGPEDREWVLWAELWLRAARDPDLRPVAARLYRRYQSWAEEVVAAGIERGEFSAAADASGVAARLIGITDGLGVRLLLSDPGMSTALARRIAAEAIAPELGIEAEALTGSAGRV